MSDFSLDDILAEVADKRSEKAAGAQNADDILNDILGENTAKRKKADDIVFTNEDFEEKKKLREREKAEEKRKTELAEKQRLDEEKRRKQLEERERIAEIKRRQVEAEQEARRKAAEEAQRKAVEAAAEKRRQAEIALKKAAEEKAEKQRLKEEAERKRLLEAEKLAALSEEERRKAEAEAAEKQRAEEESEKKFATNSIVFEDVPLELPKAAVETSEIEITATPEEIELEKTLRKQKIDNDAQKLLIKESELEDPDDFLSSINPYDFGKKTGFTEIIETIPAEQLSGDTRGVAGNELKELARASAKNDTRSFEEIVDGATTVMPDISHSDKETAFDLDKTFVLPDKFKETAEIRSTREVRRSPEEEQLIRSINKTLEQKRISDKNDTNPLVEGTGPFDKIVVPSAKGVGIKLSSDTMPRTGHIPVSDPAIAEQKIKELASKRKRRLSNFMLEDITDDDFDYDDNEEETEEIESNDDNDTSIWYDITDAHKDLKIRFILLLALTIVLGGILAVNEFLIQQKRGYFGNELGLLSNEGVVFANLIASFFGIVICKDVILGGISKLFKGKADCDSVCSVSFVIAMAGSAIHLIDTNELQQGRAFIYVPVALLGLLFNSLGKLNMINRAKKNFYLISSEGNKYYADVIDGQSEASAFTKGVVSELPFLVTMRKTSILTDFLKKIYCEDKADRLAKRLVPASLIIGFILGVLVYFLPNDFETNGVKVMENNMYWATSVFVSVVCIMSPFATMFMVNNPFRRASKALEKNGCALLGYTSAEEFSNTNSVLVDASMLFPKSAVECTNLKPCKLQNSFNNIAIDQAIILAASLAVKSKSVLSGLFFDMIGEKKELLADIDSCVYEDNMGVMGWYGNKRLIMGNREHMKHHSIKVPEMSAIGKYCRNGSDSVYLAVGGELVMIFFVRLTANAKIKSSVQELCNRNVSLVLKTTDSLITVGKITDIFDIEPDKVKVISTNLHNVYEECTKFTSSGSGSLTCNGTFLSLARGINTAKKLIKDISRSQVIMMAGVFLGTLLMIFLAFSVNLFAFEPLVIIGWQAAWLLIMLFIQSFRKY